MKAGTQGWLGLGLAVWLISGVAACKKEQPEEAPPPQAVPTQPAEPTNVPAAEPTEPAAEPMAEPAAKTETEQTESMPQAFKVDPSTSKVDFLMEAPLENIHGVAKKAMRGVLLIDPKDLSTIKGTLQIDLDRLELYQAKREDEASSFGGEKKSAKQNQHMKTWFQISDDAPAKAREENRWITFSIEGISKLSATDVTSLTGDSRVVEAVASGDFKLHGRTKKKSAPVKATFKFKGDKLVSIQLKSTRPVNVSLAEHDIRPRTAFDKLAQKTLAALGQKVAEAAPVTFSFTLRPFGAP